MRFRGYSLWRSVCSRAAVSLSANPMQTGERETGNNASAPLARASDVLSIDYPAQGPIDYHDHAHKSMQRTALAAAADRERWAASE